MDNAAKIILAILTALLLIVLLERADLLGGTLPGSNPDWPDWPS